MSGPELKPCPFCGETDQATLLIEHLEGTVRRPAYRVCCDTCGASSRYCDRSGHIDAWNTRAPVDYAALPEVQALIAAAETRALYSVATLHMLIADIRAATVGDRPMLFDLADALVAWRDEAVEAEREACIATIEDHFPGQPYASNRTKAIAAIRKRGEGQS